ncbi:DUF6603 domain-containing protein [Streptomyces chartreusis]
MATEDYLRTVVAELAEAFSPLVGALQDPSALARFLADLGWDVDEAGTQPLTDALSAVGQALTKLASDASADADLGTLVGDVAGLTAALVAAAPAAGGGLPAPLDQPAFWSALPVDLLEQLIFDHLDRRHPLAFGLLAALGVAYLEQRSADEAIGRSAYERRGIGLDRLLRFVTDPGEALQEHFGWGTDFDHRAASWALGALLRGVGADTTVGPAAPALVSQYFDELSDHRTVDQVVVSAPELASPDGVAVAKAALVVLPVPPAADRTAPAEGLVLLPTFFGQVVATFPIGTTAKLALSGTATDAPIALFVRPSGVSAEVAVAGLEAGLRARLDVAPVMPIIVAGAADSSRLELHRAHITFAVTASAAGLVVEIEAVLDLVRLVVQAGEGDGFLRQVLGEKPIEVAVGPGLAWSSVTGLRFAGQSALALDIPLDVSVLGVIDLDRLHLALRGGDAAVLEVGVSGGLSLGPFAAAVQNIGVAVRAEATDPAHPGNLGVLDLGFGFKPPTGIGLAIDTPAVRGGGFLLIDPGAGQYTGVFELTVIGTVSVKAVAIISTRLPDGTPGFALLILITAEGFTPIQLGLGFSLTGIGGLLALNRTINAEVVRNGLRDGVLDSVLLVKDPVRNAPRIISTLNRVFPIAPGRLVIGPLAEISWGSPPLVKIRLALLIDIPQPVKIVLLAQLRMVLPREKDAVVELNVDAVGVLDLGRRELALDASIHHSRLLKFTLSGDLALRLTWGDQPTFVLSVGGFHPKFPAPSGLRPLERLSLTLSGSDNPRIRFEAYLALTSNSIQLGARVSVYAEAGGFGVDGGGSFDALIQWAPFALDTGLVAWVRVFGPTGTLLGLRLALDITGPEPWHISGVAELTVLFVTVRVGVDFQLGEAVERLATESVDVAAAIWAELSRPGSWQAVLGAAYTPGATLADLADPAVGGAAGVGGAGGPLVVHPLATITGRQRVAPLDRPVSRVGAARPAAGVRDYPLQVSAPTGVRVTPASDLFASAQYVDLPEDAKLAGPSFAPMQAGVTMSSDLARRLPGHGVAGSDFGVETLDITSLNDAPTPVAGHQPLVAATGPQSGGRFEVARFAGAQAVLVR